MNQELVERALSCLARGDGPGYDLFLWLSQNPDITEEGELSDYVFADNRIFRC